MANTIIHKRSSVTGKAPQPADLTYGELAVNTADAKVYLKTAANLVIAINDWANIHNKPSGLENAASTNTAGTVVLRDASGNFAAGNITANLTGNVTGAASSNVLKSGDTMTGFLTLHADPTNALHPATKQYVDRLEQGLKAKPAAKAATSANIAATYNNGTAGVGATLTIAPAATLTIGGVSTWALQDGILVKNQTNAFQNGRYSVTQVGNASTNWILTRCALCDSASEIPGTYTFITDGTYKGTGWVQIVDNIATFTVGTNAIAVVQFAGAGEYTGGTGVTVTENTIALANSPSTANANNTLVLRGPTGDFAASTITATSFVGPLTGNASTATSAGKLTTTRALTIGNTARNFDGSAAVSWSLAEIGAQPAGSYAAATHTHSYLPLAGGTLTGNTLLNDSVKLQLGTSGDAEIYHNGTNTYIDQNITGDLYLRNNRTGGGIYLQADSTGGALQNVLQAGVGTDNACTLFANNVGRLTTTTSGVTITGVGTATTSFNAPALGVANTSNTSGLGLSLYGGAGAGLPQYGIAFTGTGVSGTHGAVVGDWATTFTIEGATNRGWIFRLGASPVASISGTGTVTATSFVGALTGNAATATTLSSYSNNWATQGSVNAVVGQLAWRKYGNNHTIFDASSSTNMAGGACDPANPGVAWQSGYPTLMGFNGGQTYGVRVDRSRYADVLATPRTINGVSFDGSANININAPASDVYAWAKASTKPTYTAAEVGAATSGHTHDYLPLAGGTLTGVLSTSTNTIAVGAAGGSNAFQVMGNAAYAASMSFHRAGAYAINLGLDTDNVFRLGGWSHGTNTYRFTSDTAGNFVAQGNVTAYSDRRLKKDITPITDALSKVEQLTGYTYERTDTGERQTGLIAQDVQAVLPEAVHTDPDGTLSLAYGNMVGLLVEAIKELKAEVADLKMQLSKK